MPGESSIESLSTDSVESVPKSTIDTVEPFRQFSFHRKAWSDIGLGRTFQFKPAQYTPQQFFFGLAPRKKCRLQLVSSKMILNRDSRKCLHPDLLDEYSTLQFNRKGVETTFRDAIIADIDELSTAERMNELITEARKGTVGPFIEFLMAYDHDEDYIWFMVSFVYSKNAQTTKQKKIFSDLKDKFRKATNLSLMRRVRDFVANLKSEDIIVEKQPAKSVDKAPAKVKVNNTTQSQASGGENDGYSSSSQKKRKPQYTQAEKAAYKDRKKQARIQKKSGGEFGGDVSKKNLGSLQSLNTDPFLNTNFSGYSRTIFKWDGGAGVHVVKDRSLLSNFRPDVTCNLLPARGEMHVRGAGDIKVRFKDGSVGVLYDVFLDETLNSNIISTNLYNHFHTGVVEDKLYRLDTGAEIGYMKHGAPEVEVEVLSFDSPISPDVYKKNTLTILPTVVPEERHETSKDSVDDDDARAIVVAEDPDFAVTDEIVHVERFSTRVPSAKDFYWHEKLGHPGREQFRHSEEITENSAAVKHVPINWCDTCLHAKMGDIFQESCKIWNRLKDHLRRLDQKGYPRQLRSDNGAEFLNDNVQNFCEEHGIKKKGALTQSYSSHQNGVVERKHPINTAKISSVATWCRCTIDLLARSSRMSAIQLNYSASQPLEWEFPAEKWLGRDISDSIPDLPTFGCLVHALS
ncbi:hypothetical protein JCM33374_g2922 [Metschnikowia sp. JCM 33374]|nr:hypothetical protein JCM33374_g2922 [Metschnikowia sp. JCM 33374]